MVTKNKNLLLKGFLTLLLLVMVKGYAQDVSEFTSQDINDRLTTSNTLEHVTTALDGAGLVNVNPMGYVSLYVKENEPPNAWYSYVLNLTVTPILVTGVADDANSYAITLSVENSRRTASSGIAVDLSKHVIKGSYGAKITLTSSSYDNLANNAPPINNRNAPENIGLIVGFEAQTFYELSTAIPSPTTLPLAVDSNELAITWGAIEGAESYDVEWTWVDSYSETFVDPRPMAAIPFSTRDFRLNSTRVQTENTQYSIPLIYSKGYLIYRVRAVGRWLADTSKYKYGLWSRGDGNEVTVDNWNPYVYTIDADHEVDKNWQFQASYAEEGKKKEVVSYFDGTLRNRQTVTKINSDNNVIVGEVIYDAQGRPAVEVLPVPTANGSSIGYRPDFNQNNTGLVYSYQDFDLDDQNILDETPTTKAMSNTMGASKYYSPQNDVASDFTARIPDAQNHPFSQIEYMPDNTGRIRRKSGVGVQHQLGSKHEMEYYYGVPEQKELNRLFGYSVGHFSHYKKNLVVDPNRQSSVSYIDPQGRTIATALVGDKPDKLNRLRDEREDLGLHDFINVDLLGKLAQGDADTDIDNNIKQATQTFGAQNDALLYTATKVAPADKKFTFNYSLNNSVFTYECKDGVSSNYPLVYDLTFDVLKADGSSLLLNPIPPLTSNNGTVNYEIPDLEIDIPRGSYTINKNLVVNSATVEQYADEYISRLTTEGDECYIAPEVITTLPDTIIDGCFTTCEECEDALETDYGGRDAFAQAQIDAYDFSSLDYLTPDELAEETAKLRVAFEQQWDDLIEACNAPCNDGTNLVDTTTDTSVANSVSCNIVRSQLLDDLKPSGQYGQNPSALSGNAITSFTQTNLNIFNDQNVLLSTKVADNLHNSWRNPRNPTYDTTPPTTGALYTEGHYYDEDGLISYIRVKRIVTIVDDVEEVTYEPALRADMSADPIPVTDNFDGDEYLVEPQYLENVEYFIKSGVWQDQWAESLLVYHPEYCYLEYAEAVCGMTATVNTATMNSDGYDQYLRLLTTYAEAAPILTSTTSLGDNDPYFSTQIPNGFENGALFGARNDLINEALTTNYNGTNLNLLEISYATVACNSIGSCSEADGATFTDVNNLTLEKRDQFWNIYKANYINVKQTIQSLFANIYAKNNDCYNGCIGDEAPPVNLISVISDYSTDVKNTISTNIGGTEDLCDYQYANEYQTKEKRFKPSDNLYDSGASAADVAADLAEFTGYEYYVQTGLCPMARDLQVYLEYYFQEYATGGLTNNRNYTGTYLSAALFEDLGGVYPTDQVIVSNTVGVTELQISLGVGDIPITVNLPAGFENNWGTYGNWVITKLNNINTDYDDVNDVFTFSAVAQWRTSLTAEDFEEVIISGTTQARISNCSITEADGIGEYLGNGDVAGPLGDCNIESSFSNAFLELLNELYTSNSINTNVTLSNLATYNGGYMSTFFGGSVATWMPLPGNIYMIDIDGVQRFALTLEQAVPATGVANFTGVNFSYDKNSKGRIVQQAASITYLDTNFGKNSITGTLAEEGGTLINFLCCGEINDLVGDPDGPIDPVCEDETFYGDLFETDFVALLNAFIANGIFSDKANINFEVGNLPEYTPFLQDFFTYNSADLCEKTANEICNDMIDFSNTTYVLAGSNVQGSNSSISIYFSDIHHFFFQTFRAHNFSGMLSVVSFTHNGNFNYTMEYVDRDGITQSVLMQGSQYRINSTVNRGRILYFGCDLFESYVNYPIQGDPATLDNVDVDYCSANAVEENQLEELMKDSFNAYRSFSKGEITEQESNLVYDNLFFSGADGQGFDLNYRYKTLLVPFYAANFPNVVYDDNFSFYEVDNRPFGVFGSIRFRAFYASDTRSEFEFFYEDDFFNVDEILDIKILSNDLIGGRSLKTTITYINTNGETIIAKNVFIFMRRSEKYQVSPGVISTLQSVPFLCDILAVPPPTAAQLASGASTTTTKSTFDTSYFDRILVTEGDVSNKDLISGEFTPLNKAAITAKIATKSIAADLARNDCGSEICIPPLLAPVSCTAQYPIYETLMNNLGLPADEIINEIDFCNSSLQYLVSDYQYFITSFGITSSLNLEYMSITRFGATEYNYGYTGIRSVIDSYKLHVEEQRLAGVIPKTWAAFTSEQLFDNPDCVPAPFPVDFGGGNAVIEIPEETTCEQFKASVSVAYTRDIYESVIEAKREEFVKAYIEHAINNAVETLEMKYFDKEYQYTLYYYDQAGNLVQTVPPQGVKRFTNEQLDGGLNAQINAYRAENTAVENPALLPDHIMKTQYRYNSLNQLVWQRTPDGGETRFAYDDLGRIIASQNAKQLNNNKFSYTNYDFLGRIVEAGELTPNVAVAIQETTGKLVFTADNTYVPTTDKENPENIIYPQNISDTQVEVTNTLYSEPVTFAAEIFDTVNAENNNSDNSRNRVTAVYYYDTKSAATNVASYDNATFYNYDIHGNVQELVQHNKLMVLDASNPNSGMKKVLYEYDLISGNVNQVTYQKGQPDMFAHRYMYDADNRITAVETSSDGMVWEKDASYEYYAHGPLARTVIGDKQVQGMDYAYTLQGWLKGVNSETMRKRDDMGGDAVDASSVARDAMGYSLNYFADDYQAIGTTPGATFVYSTNTSAVTNTNRDLYNGNIKQMVTGLLDTDENRLESQLNNYRYDQLNRIRGMVGYGVDNGNASENYSSTYRYDRNGNLDKLTRNTINNNGNNIVLMDDLDYSYKELPNPDTGALERSNQLDFVHDEVNGSRFGDLRRQTSGNYEYDAIGQLTRDRRERLKNIEWRVDGKVRAITKNDDSSITFTYDGLGNRIAKTDVDENKTTLYVRDAQGNVMGVYEKNGTGLFLEEHHIYGSSRLGLEKKNLEITEAVAAEENIFTRSVGDKRFELSNHLGNVLSVVTDRKIGNTGNYRPDVIAYNDYYPFGMLLPNRHASDSDYRYGFQGQEKDDEIKGEGNSLNYKFRMHDPRVGRFFAPDPLERNYPYYTPYSFSGNKVIAFRELEGMEQRYYGVFLRDGGSHIHELKDSQTNYWLLPDSENFRLYDDTDGRLLMTFSFHKRLHGLAQQDLANPYDRYKEFIEDPIGSVLSGEFKTNEEIVGTGVEDIMVTLVMRKMAKLPRGSRKALPGATGKSMPAWLKRIREGIAFQQRKLEELTAQKVKFAGGIRVVPKNGKGKKGSDGKIDDNVPGNRSDTDALILNEDGITYTIKEYKLTSKTPLSTGQRAALKHVEKGDGVFEVRSDVNINGIQLKKGQSIKITKYKIEVKEKL